MLDGRWTAGKFVCVGLDSEFAKLPEAAKQDGFLDTLVGFNAEIVDATADVACAFKINTAFYEAYGSEGLEALEETCEHIAEAHSNVPIILDAKRADIGNTNEQYAKFAFDRCKADAITVHPYLGAVAMKPFLDHKDKGIIVLCRTSNEGADEMQDAQVVFGSAGLDRRAYERHIGAEEPMGSIPYYRHVAFRVATHWNRNGNCGLVVGATYPDEMVWVRKIAPDLPLLIPGIGAQGGDLGATLKAGRDLANRGMIINSSRGIIFASKNDDYAEAAHREAHALNEAIAANLNS